MFVILGAKAGILITAPFTRAWLATMAEVRDAIVVVSMVDALLESKARDMSASQGGCGGLREVRITQLYR